MAQDTYSRGKPFWNAYIRGRPDVPDSFFERFYRYHAASGGKFDDVNDVGAGLGNLSVRLAERFSRVIVTEPSERTLKDSETFIRQVADDVSQFSFVQAAAEDDVLAPASVDAVFSCNTMHWVDLDKALPLFAKQLNSGGTLFLAMTGIPVLRDPAANALWRRLISSSLPEAVKDLDKRTWYRACQIQESGYDAIAVPEDLFESEALRVRLNASEDMHEFRPNPGGKAVATPTSHIGIHDEVQHAGDDSWAFQTDIDGLRDMFGAYVGQPEETACEGLWQELEQQLTSGQASGFYPVSMIMATRK